MTKLNEKIIINELNNILKGKKPKKFDNEIYDLLLNLFEKIKFKDERLHKMVHFNEKIIENALSESKEKLTTVFESSRDGIVILNTDSEIIEINNRLSKIMSLDKKDIIGKEILKFEIFSKEDKKNMYDDFKKLLEGKKYIVKEYFVKILDNEKYLEIHSSSLKKNNKITGVVCIIRDITEQKLAEIALKKSEEKFKNQFLYYKELDDIKNDFISLLSHELKSPLVPIISYCDLLNNNVLGKLSDKQKSVISSMKESANELLKMIEEILDISRIERNTMKYTFSEFNLSNLLKDIIKSEKGFASSKNLKIVSKIKNKNLMINTDKTKLSRAIHNLLNNAVKFTKKGNITIYVKEDKKNIFISVKDSGIGIPDNKKDKIFTKFFQIDSSLSRKYKGTGIGLYNTKLVIEGLNGNITFNSEKGKGTEFIISLPKKRVKEQKNIAIIGASPNKNRMSNKAIRAYLKNGFNVYPINPKYSIIEDLKVYSSLSELKIKPTIISVYTNPKITKTLINDIVKINPKKTFFNPGSTNKNTISLLNKTKLNFERLCSIMALGENPQDF